MNFNIYDKFITSEHLMGPNSLRILKELLEKHPLRLEPSDELLDLGCGKGLTSLMLANETPAKITAADLWITAEENNAHFQEWGMGNRIQAIQADARALPVQPKQFHALVSVDSYHYFGTGADFFAEKMLPLLCDGSAVCIGIPGIKDEYSNRSEELLHPWLKDEAYMFRSPTQWKEIIGQNERIAHVETWKMECFEAAWENWFRTGHPYANVDHTLYESIIAPYSCIVGIFVQLH